jgi:DNA-binding CsgD family transcriptional regulator
VVNTQELRNDRRVDDRRLLDLVGEVVGLLDVTEFHAGLLAAVRHAVPCDWISLNDLAEDPADTVVLIEPPFAAEAHQLFAEHALGNPLVERYQRTQDGRAYRFSDVATPEQLHATALYRHFYEPLGLEHQIAFTLPHSSKRLIALALSRRDADFGDDERDLLDAARPFLIQCYRNAVEHTRLRTELELRSHARRLPLTHPPLAAALADLRISAREAEVLSWVATGRSDRAVAGLLEVSERTVQKHLQGCFAKLGVHDRKDAVARAWSFVGAAGPGQSLIEPR